MSALLMLAGIFVRYDVRMGRKLRAAIRKEGRRMSECEHRRGRSSPRTPPATRYRLVPCDQLPEYSAKVRIGYP